MLRTKRATWMMLVPLAIVGALHGGCSAEVDDIDRTGESDKLKGDCTLAADDGNPCTLEGCVGQENEHKPFAGLPCGVNNSLTCLGDGRCGGCTTPDQCGQSTVCKPFSCDSGVCNQVNAPAGTSLPTQISGDCKEEQCDGNGGTLMVNDDSDTPNTQCQITSCVAGTPMSQPAAQGTECTVGGGKSCDGEGNCVECITDADCGQVGQKCDPNTKTCFSCSDGIQNGSETDIDCGGGQCTDCAQGKKCKVVNDCLAPTTCADGVCCNSACDTACYACDLPGTVGQCKGVKKYGEDPNYGNGMSCLNSNGLACSGGGACGKKLGATCVADPDCASGQCADPDGNGQVTCVKGAGDMCTQPVECASNMCTNSVCAP